MPDENQAMMRVFVEKPSKRDLALAIKQVLNDSGLTGDKLVELATAQVTEHVTRILNAALGAKKYDDLIVKALVTATSTDRDSFMRARSDGHMWHHYLKTLMEKALAESVLKSVDIKVCPKDATPPAIAVEELDERAQAFNVLAAPGKAELALRRQTLAKKLEDLDAAEKHVKYCEEELSRSLAYMYSSGYIQVRRTNLTEANTRYETLIGEVISAARSVV